MPLNVINCDIMNCRLCNDAKFTFWMIFVFSSLILFALLLFDGEGSSHHFSAMDIDSLFRKPQRKLLSRNKLMHALSQAASMNPNVPPNIKSYNQNKTALKLSSKFKCDNKEERKIILVMSFGFEVDSLG